MATQEQRTSIVWDYAPAPESPDHVRLRDSYGLFIDGSFVDPVDGTRVPSINPATEDVVAEVAFAGPGDVARAVQAARAAQPGWAALSGLERGKYLFRVARLIQERARELAIVESMDGGKPIRESRDVDVPLAAAHFFHYAGWADKLSYGMGGRAVEPLGVAAQIVPWNFPLLMAAWKLAPALACGQHGGAEARRDDAGHGAAPRRDHPGGRAAAGRGRRSSPATAPPARRSCASPTSTRWPSPARPPSARTSRPRSRAAGSR